MKSSRSKRVIDLGKEIVASLDMERGNDTTARWMAHHVARLMEEAETAPAKGRKAAENAASSAILALWKHRSTMAPELRPFGDWEAVLHTLKALNPKSKHSRYFSFNGLHARELDKNPELAKMLAAVEGVDYTARIISIYMLALATKPFQDKTRRWLKLSEGMERDSQFERSVIEILSNLGDELEVRAAQEHLKDIEDKLNRLQGFLKVAGDIEQLLREGRDAAMKALGPQAANPDPSNPLQ